ncbi:MAG TPA: hypothetical protein PLO78_10210 [Candidatus Omnitrophota bacterium]|nr:hypothetical protein [Candidatus Omnitrophota bacterium]
MGDKNLRAFEFDPNYWALSSFVQSMRGIAGRSEMRAITFSKTSKLLEDYLATSPAAEHKRLKLEQKLIAEAGLFPEAKGLLRTMWERRNGKLDLLFSPQGTLDGRVVMMNAEPYMRPSFLDLFQGHEAEHFPNLKVETAISNGKGPEGRPEGTFKIGNVTDILRASQWVLDQIKAGVYSEFTEEDRKAGKKRVWFLSLDGGIGTRAGNYTLANGGVKGPMLMLGQHLGAQAIESAKILAAGLPAGEWFIPTPSDNVLVGIRPRFEPGRRLFIFPKSERVFPDLDQDGVPMEKTVIDEQKLTYLTGLGHAMVDSTMRVEAFREKPGEKPFEPYQVFELLLKYGIGQWYEEHHHGASAPDFETAKKEFLTAFEEFVDDSQLKNNQRDFKLENILLPYLLAGENGKSVWAAIFGTSRERDFVAGLNSPQWTEMRASVKAAVKTGPELKTFLEGLLKHIRFTNLNTFYFAFSREVADAFLDEQRGYRQVTVNANGTYFQSTRDTELDWSKHVLTPMTVSKEAWMSSEYYDEKAKKLYPDARDWEKLWDIADYVKKAAGGWLSAAPFGSFWFDTGKVSDIDWIVRLAVQTDRLWPRFLIREAFRLPLFENEVNARYPEKQVTFEDRNNYLLIHSVIKVPKGVKVKIGKGVVLDHTELEIVASPGEIVEIPDGTILTGVRLRGSLIGHGTNRNFYHYTGTSLDFDTKPEFIADIALKDQQGIVTLRHSMNIDPNSDKPLDVRRQDGTLIPDYSFINQFFPKDKTKRVFDFKANFESLVQQIRRMRSETRVSGEVAVPGEAALLRNVELEEQRLQAALQNPALDYDLIIVGAHETNVDLVKAHIKTLAGRYYHPDKKVVVMAPERHKGGSLTDPVSLVDKTLQEVLGSDYKPEQLADMRVAILLMSGRSDRMAAVASSALFNKGMEPMPGNSFLVERCLTKRFQHISKVPGVYVFTGDSPTISEHFVEPSPTADFQLFAHWMGVENPKVERLGLIVPQPGAQVYGPRGIKYAGEKFTRQEIQVLQKTGKITDSKVLVNEADYFVSWNGFASLKAGFQWLRSAAQRQLTKDEASKVSGLMWIENLFEPQYGPIKRSANLGGSPAFRELQNEFFNRVAKGNTFAVVDTGINTRYDNLNGIADYYQYLIDWTRDDLLQAHNKLKAVREGAGFREDIAKRFPGRFIDKSVIIHPDVKSEDIGPGAIILGMSVIMPGSKIGGVVVNGIGKLKVPSGAFAHTVISFEEVLSVLPGNLESHFFVMDGLERLFKVKVVLPRDFDLRQEIEGIPINELKIFPREPSSEKLPLNRRETDPRKYSLRELRDMTEGVVIQRIFWEFLPELLSRKNISAEEVVGQLRQELKNLGLMLPAARAELRELPPVDLEAVSAMEKALEVVQQPAAVKPAPQAPAGMLEAAGAVSAIQQQVFLDTEIVNAKAVGVETKLVQAIVDALKTHFGLVSKGEITRILAPFDRDVLRAIVSSNPNAIITVPVQITDDAGKNAQIMKNARSEVRQLGGRIHLIFVTRIDVESLAKAQARAMRLELTGGKSKSVIQVRKIKAALTKEDRQAYALVARIGGIVVVVGFEKDVSFATELTVSDIITVAYEAAKTFAKSA